MHISVFRYRDLDFKKSQVLNFFQFEKLAGTSVNVSHNIIF